MLAPRHKLISLSHDAILDLAPLADDRAVAEETAGDDGALADVDVVHEDAVGEADLLLDLAVGAQDRVLQGRLPGDVGVFADLAFGANLRKRQEGPC